MSETTTGPVVTSSPAWAELSEADKRAHLAQSHGYLPEAKGGHADDADAWVEAGTGTVEDLDRHHATDHGDFPGGGGLDVHDHADN